VEASAPTTLISLGFIPGGSIGLAHVDASWIRITSEHIAVWLFNDGPSRFFMRLLPEPS
jgi:hypothetical protein